MSTPAVYLVPVDQHVGASLRCVALRIPLDAATLGELTALWINLAVLVARAKQLEQRDLVNFTKQFGPPRSEFRNTNPTLAVVT
jgi:alpha-ketoglutarate-dependent taurine dioxygenase